MYSPFGRDTALLLCNQVDRGNMQAESRSHSMELDFASRCKSPSPVSWSPKGVMSVSHSPCGLCVCVSDTVCELNVFKYGRSEGGRVCLFQLSLSLWGRWGLQLLQKPIRLSRKIRITPNQHHDMEDFYFFSRHSPFNDLLDEQNLSWEKGMTLIHTVEGLSVFAAAAHKLATHSSPILVLSISKHIHNLILTRSKMSSGACATADALINNKSYFSFSQSLTQQPMLKLRKQSYSLV